MAFNLGNLIWKITGDTSDFTEKIDNSNKKLDAFSKKAAKIGKEFTLKATAPIAALGGVAINAASDLGESLNAISVVFKGAQKTINDFGENAADSVGLSQQAFNELATVTGTLLKTTGQSLDSVANSTITLSKRAADVASVFNDDVNVTLEAFNAALRGEAEPARRFGVLLSESAVQAEIAASGLDKLTGLTEEQIKVQARYNIILNQTAEFQGDFANTADSLENRSKILKATLQDTAAELGEKLLPFATDVLNVVADLVKGFSNLDDETQKLILSVAGFVAAIGPLSSALAFATSPAGWLTLAVAASAALSIEWSKQPTLIGNIREKVLELNDKIKDLNDNFKTAAELTRAGIFAGATKEELDRELTSVGQQIRATDDLITSKKKAIEIINDEIEIAKKRGVGLAAAAFQVPLEQAKKELAAYEATRKQQEEYLKSVLEAKEKLSELGNETVETVEKIKKLETIDPEKLRVKADDVIIELKEIETGFNNISDQSETSVREINAALSKIGKAEFDEQPLLEQIEITRQLYGETLDLGISTFTAIDAAVLNSVKIKNDAYKFERDEAFETYKANKILSERAYEEQARLQLAGVELQVQAEAERRRIAEETETAIQEARKKTFDAFINAQIQQAQAVSDNISESLAEIDSKIRALQSTYDTVVNSIFSATKSIFNGITGVVNNSYDDQLAAAEGNAAEIDRIRREQFEALKVQRSIETVINTAAAIVGFLANPGGIAGAALSIAAGIEGIAQLATINSANYNSPAPAAAASASNIQNTGPAAPEPVEQETTQPIAPQIILEIDSEVLYNSIQDGIDNGQVRLK
jgi:hypothetical protein